MAAIAATISSPARHRAPPARARRAPRPGRRPGWRTPRRGEAPRARTKRGLSTQTRAESRLHNTTGRQGATASEGAWSSQGEVGYTGLAMHGQLDPFATTHHVARHPASQFSQGIPARHGVDRRMGGNGFDSRSEHNTTPPRLHGGVPATEHQCEGGGGSGSRTAHSQIRAASRLQSTNEGGDKHD